MTGDPSLVKAKHVFGNLDDGQVVIAGFRETKENSTINRDSTKSLYLFIILIRKCKICISTV